VKELVLGVDIGTASTKAVLAAPDGEIVARARRNHDLELPRPGWVEQDAEGVWWRDVVEVVRELGHDARDAIAAVCVSGLGPCLVPCDGRVRPLRRAILYGIDTRAADEIAELNARYGVDEILRHAGSPLTSQAIGPKLLWLQRNEPDVWERTAGWYSASSFAVGRLTGEYVLDHHTASQCDPLYVLEREEWDEEWAAELSPGVALPRLVWPGEVAGEVSELAAYETGLRRGTPVMGGTVDAWAEALSGGVRAPGDLMLMYGSTMFLVRVARPAVPNPGLWTTIGIDPGSRTYAAGMATSGSLTAWFSELAGGADFSSLASAAAGVPPGARGLLVLPFFAGERSPIFDPDLRGVIAGLTLSHGHAELARAVYEGTAYSVRHNLEVIEAAAGATRRIVAVGGGTQARVWMEIVSSVAGISQEIPAETIGAAYGDALLAATGAGLAPAGSDWSLVADVVEPDERSAEAYHDLFARYLELHEAVAPVSHRLAEFGRGERTLGSSVI